LIAFIQSPVIFPLLGYKINEVITKKLGFLGS